MGLMQWIGEYASNKSPKQQNQEEPEERIEDVSKTDVRDLPNDAAAIGGDPLNTLQVGTQHKYVCRMCEKVNPDTSEFRTKDGAKEHAKALGHEACWTIRPRLPSSWKTPW